MKNKFIRIITVAGSLNNIEKLISDADGMPLVEEKYSVVKNFNPYKTCVC